MTSDYVIINLTPPTVDHLWVSISVINLLSSSPATTASLLGRLVFYYHLVYLFCH